MMVINDATWSGACWLACVALRQGALFLGAQRAARWFRRAQHAVVVGGLMDVIDDELLGMMAHPPRTIALPLAFVVVIVHVVVLVSLMAGVVELLGSIGPRRRQRRRRRALVRSRPAITGSVTIAPSRA